MKGKFLFPQENQEHHNVENGYNKEPDSLEHSEGAMELEDIRYIDSELNPNSPVNKGTAFIFNKNEKVSQ